MITYNVAVSVKTTQEGISRTGIVWKRTMPLAGNVWGKCKDVDSLVDMATLNALGRYVSEEITKLRITYFTQDKDGSS